MQHGYAKVSSFRPWLVVLTVAPASQKGIHTSACRLGLYAGLKDRGPCNAAELAKEMDLSERYIREWLLQQVGPRMGMQLWMRAACAACMRDQSACHPAARGRYPCWQLSPHLALQLCSTLGGSFHFAAHEHLSSSHPLVQAAAKIIACDAEAEQFWLTPAQADVLVHEHGKDASPYFFVGRFQGHGWVGQTACKHTPVCRRESAPGSTSLCGAAASAHPSLSPQAA